MARIVILSRRSVRHPLAGGADRYVHEIFRRLTDRHSVTILSSGGILSKSIEEIDGIEYRHFPEAFHRILLPVRYMAKFDRKTDLLIDNSDVGIPWFSPLYVRVPRLTIIHQLVREIFFDELPRPISDLGFKIEPLIYRLYSNSRIVAASQSTAGDLMRCGIQRKNIDVIEPGCSSSGFPRTMLFDRSSLTISCLSRLMKYKRLELAFKAFTRVIRRSPHVRLLIAGSGPYRLELVQMAKNLGISNNVSFLGRISEGSKFKLYSESRIAIAPSVREGFGISVMEANSVGTPVVAWDVPGLRDSIVNNETGLLAPFPDEQAFAEDILRLLNDDDTWNRLSQNAWNWSATHSWERAAERFNSVIASSLSSEP